MTFADRCILCGGPVLVGGEDWAKCVGFCGLEQEKIEDMTPTQFHRMFKSMQRVIALAEAEDVDVKGDRL